MCAKHFVTTNNVSLPLDVLDRREHYAKLDFVAFDNYPGFFEMLMRQQGSPASPPPDIANFVALGHDFARSLHNKPFMIMEQQSGKAGQKTFSAQPEKGQVRLWTYQ